MLDNVTTGVVPGAKVHVLYGVNKIGKTTFVCDAPKHLLLDIEKGSGDIPHAKRIRGFSTLEIFEQTIDDLILNPRDFKVIGVDSVEALEVLIVKTICDLNGSKSIDDVGGGFGKGYTQARDVMNRLMDKFRKLADDHGIEVFLIGHSQTKTHTDPMTNTQYDRHTLRTNEKMASIIRDRADSILFVGRKMMEAKKDSKDIIVSDNKPYMYTQWRTGFDAGNRLNLPFEIPLGFQNFQLAREANRPVTIEDIKKEAAGLIAGLDKETRPKAEESLKKASTVAEVAAIKQRVQTLVTT